MTALEDLRDVFSIFHDGVITEWKGDEQKLTLVIDCQYLAQLVNQSFEKFYLEIQGIRELNFSTWPSPSDLPVQILTTPTVIFKADLEILHSQIAEDNVSITCKQDDTDFDYSGGTLTVSCEKVKVYDQAQIEISIERLGQISNDYWNGLRNS